MDEDRWRHIGEMVEYYREAYELDISEQIQVRDIMVELWDELQNDRV